MTEAKHIAENIALAGNLLGNSSDTSILGGTDNRFNQIWIGGTTPYIDYTADLQFKKSGANSIKIESDGRISGLVDPSYAQDASTKKYVDDRDALLVLLQPTADVIINEAGSDFDFKIAASEVPNALFVQGSDSYVGIGVDPLAKLHVSGELRVSDTADVAKYIQTSHDANNAVIKNTEGSIYIKPKNNTLIVESATDDSDADLTIKPTGAAKKAELHIHYGTDGTKYLKLFRDGTNAFIESESGDIVLRGKANDITQIRGRDDTYYGELHLVKDSTLNNALKIYYNGTNAEIVTRTGGDIYIKPVDGNVVIQKSYTSGNTYLDVVGYDSNDRGYLRLFYGNSIAGNNLQLQYNNNGHGIISTSSGHIYLESATAKIHVKNYLELWTNAKPATGSQGIIVWDGTHFWGCTASGTPGTWAQLDNA